MLATMITAATLAAACVEQREAVRHQIEAQRHNERASVLLTGRINAEVLSARLAVAEAALATYKACPAPQVRK